MCTWVCVPVLSLFKVKLVEGIKFLFLRGEDCREGCSINEQAQRKQKWSEVAQLCLTLCDPMACSLPGSSIHGIFQARILEQVAISFSRRSSRPRDWTQASRIVGRRFTVWATRETGYFVSLVAQWRAICFRVGCLATARQSTKCGPFLGYIAPIQHPQFFSMYQN